MSPAQRTLAREALGLVDGQAQSRRNRQVVHIVGDAVVEWAAMVGKRLAEIDPTTTAGPSFRAFRLTRAGAERALDPGETLDPDHFPPMGQE